MFWAHWRSTDRVGSTVLTWLVYSVVTSLALAVARRYHITSLRGWYLVGGTPSTDAFEWMPTRPRAISSALGKENGRHSG
jgi:hypothetical protein